MHAEDEDPDLLLARDESGRVEHLVLLVDVEHGVVPALGVEDPPPFSGQIKHGADEDGDAEDTVAQEATLRLEDIWP